jgi:hypothetical protein
MLDYCYEAVFILEGVKVDGSLKGDQFSLEPDPHDDRRAYLKYDFCMPKLSEKEAEDKALREGTDFLSFALLGIYLRNGASGFSAKFVKIQCVNCKELTKAGQQLPMFSNVRFSTVYRFSEKTLKDVIDELEKYSPGISRNIWTALGFWRAGLSSDDVYVRFEQIWKAFEIFYREITGRREIDIAGVQHWLTKVLSPKNLCQLCNQYSVTGDAELAINVKIAECKSPLDCLVKQNYSSKSGAINYSKNLEDALAKNNYQEILANSLVCLAKLRNQIFHANIFGDQERPLVFVCSSILADVLTSAFLSHINNKPSQVSSQTP